jgi:cell division protein FtsQ
LDVKVHTEGRTHRRLTRIGGGLVVVGLVALSGFGLYRGGKWAADRLVFENPRFIVSQIEVRNTGVLEAPVIARFAGVAVGQNLLAVDLEEARRQLELVPLIRRAQVRRVMPARLVIEVEERIPVARLGDGGAGRFYVDRSGVVMKPIKLADGTVVEPHGQGPLPWITGVPIAQVQVGRRVELEAVYRALALLEQFSLSPVGTWVEVERVDVSKPGRLTVVTTQGMVAQFDAAEDLTPAVRRLGAILWWAQQRQKAVRTVDLTVSRAVPVTFVN